MCASKNRPQFECLLDQIIPKQLKMI